MKNVWVLKICNRKVVRVVEGLMKGSSIPERINFNSKGLHKNLLREHNLWVETYAYCLLVRSSDFYTTAISIIAYTAFFN